MKKILILVFILVLCTGCVRIDNTNDYDVIANNTLDGVHKSNTASHGYKYYLPIGVSKVYDKDYNQKFKLDDAIMYLYVDIVSYHYKSQLNLINNSDSNYYFKEISNGTKNGYIKITEEDDLYFIEIVYNYAKIESYVCDIDIDNVVANSLIILDSIDYNDKLISKILEDDYFNSVDKNYKIRKPDDAESKFSEYLSEYVQSEDSSSVSNLPEY